MVEALSGGRIAYVHVKGMDSPSFRNVYSELLSDRNRNKEAVIVDTRHNGGRLVARRPGHFVKRKRIPAFRTSRTIHRQRPVQ